MSVMEKGFSSLLKYLRQVTALFEREWDTSQLLCSTPHCTRSESLGTRHKLANRNFGGDLKIPKWCLELTVVRLENFHSVK